MKNFCCETNIWRRNRILRGQIKGRQLLSEGEKATLAEIAHRLGRMVLEDVAATAKPDTILRRLSTACHTVQLIAPKFIKPYAVCGAPRA
jgi:hypothetical protein